MEFNINDYKGKYVMHCKTKEEARDFIGKHLPSLWHEGSCCWNSYKSDTVYFFNRKTYQNIPYAEKEGYTILEWSDFMNKGFTKADLKTGDIVKFDNEELGIVITEHKVIACKNGGWINLNNIKEDLTNSFYVNKFNIIAVRRPYDQSACSFDAFRNNAPRGVLVYERKEVEEMTLAEVCKLLGKEIKIVKG